MPTHRHLAESGPAIFRGISLLWKSLERLNLLKAVHPVQTFGCLDLHAGRQCVGVVERRELHFDETRENVVVTIKQAGTAVGAEASHGRPGRIAGFWGAACNLQGIFGIFSPGHDRGAGGAAAIIAVAEAHGGGFVFQFEADGAATTLSDMCHW